MRAAERLGRVRDGQRAVTSDPVADLQVGGRIADDDELFGAFGDLPGGEAHGDRGRGRHRPPWHRFALAAEAGPARGGLAQRDVAQAHGQRGEHEHQRRGRERPASSSGRPGSSHAAASSAGTVVMAANSPAATRPGGRSGGVSGSLSGWLCGDWLSGDWLSGDWLSGSWFSGSWLSGSWFSGSWFSGGWFSGGWFSGGWGSRSGGTAVSGPGVRIGTVLSSLSPLWSLPSTSKTSVTSEEGGSGRTHLL